MTRTAHRRGPPGGSLPSGMKLEVGELIDDGGLREATVRMPEPLGVALAFCQVPFVWGIEVGLLGAGFEGLRR